MLDWETAWAPYDETTYREALAFLQPWDVVLDIGAGDLRLARLAAPRTRRVYAIELRPELVAAARRQGPWPHNLHVIVGDARTLPFPPGISVAVLLMRHCCHFHLYVQKLRAVGCRYLVTNARWRMGVECVDLMAPRVPFRQAPPGWYACLCGAVGFIPLPPEMLTEAVFERVHEVEACPACSSHG